MDDVGGHGHDLDGALGRWSLYMPSYVHLAHVRDCLFDNDHNVLAMAENALGEIAWNSCRYALEGGALGIDLTLIV